MKRSKADQHSARETAIRLTATAVILTGAVVALTAARTLLGVYRSTRKLRKSI